MKLFIYKPNIYKNRYAYKIITVIYVFKEQNNTKDCEMIWIERG